MLAPLTFFLCRGHLEELGRCQHSHTKFPCLGQLAPGVLAANQIVGLAAHRAAGVGAQRFDLGVDLAPGVRLHLSGDHNGLSHKGIVRYSGFRYGRGRDVNIAAQLRPEAPVLLLLEPLADVLVQCIPKVGQLGAPPPSL